jgi:hypothetical protein
MKTAICFIAAKIGIEKTEWLFNVSLYGVYLAAISWLLMFCTVD